MSDIWCLLDIWVFIFGAAHWAHYGSAGWSDQIFARTAVTRWGRSGRVWLRLQPGPSLGCRQHWDSSELLSIKNHQLTASLQLKILLKPAGNTDAIIVGRSAKVVETDIGTINHFLSHWKLRQALNDGQIFYILTGLQSVYCPLIIFIKNSCSYHYKPATLKRSANYNFKLGLDHHSAVPAPNPGHCAQQSGLMIKKDGISWGWLDLGGGGDSSSWREKVFENLIIFVSFDF